LLKCVRELSPVHLESVCASEASLFGVLKDHLCESKLGCEENVSCWMALFVLGCRNGLSVVASADVFEAIEVASNASAASFAVAMTSGEIDGALRVACVANNCFWLLEEGLTKSAPTVRVRLERYHGQLAKSFFGGFAKAFAVDVSAPTRVIARVVELKLLKAEEVILACGAAGLLICHAILHAKAFAECETAALFDGVLALLRRVCPSPFPAEWWVATCAKVVAAVCRRRAVP
jgi:hypothetical protein